MKNILQNLLLLCLAFVYGIAPTAASGAFSTLYTFTNGLDGAVANGGPVVSGNMIYDTSAFGGSSLVGNVFGLRTYASSFNVIYGFSGNDGATPFGAPILSGNTLYGVTYMGGSNNQGNVFKVNTDGSGFAILHDFSPYDTNGDNLDGSNPYGTLALSGNTLYGAGSAGGSNGFGTIFRVNTDGTGFATLYNFTGQNDGSEPWTPLLVVSNRLFGAAQATVFSLNTDGSDFTVLHAFSGTDGAVIISPLIASGNVLYGTASFNGPFGSGDIFSVHTDGSNFAIVHAFSALDANGNNYDGAESLTNGQIGGGCICALSGNTLYGTASYGGANGTGTIFSLNTDGSAFTTLYNFSAMDANGDNGDGANPEGMTFSGGVLYGATFFGGAEASGVVFSFSPGVETGNSPLLNIVPFGTNVVLSWPSQPAGYLLQSSSSLGPLAVWSQVPTSPTTANGTNFVTNQISGTSMFFRLSQ